MSLRNALRKAASLLVELPPEETMPDTDFTASAPVKGSASGELDDLLKALDDKGPNPVAIPGQSKSVEQIVRDTPGPNLDQIQVPADPAAVAEDGSVDFLAVYRSAKLEPVSFGAEQMLAMITSLPKELPLDVKRQTVKVSLTALGQSLGATPETIVADASRKLAALAAYEESFTESTTEKIAMAEKEIAAFQAEIELRRKAILDSRTHQAQVSRHCVTEADRIDDILEFFSMDVPPSKYAAP